MAANCELNSGDQDTLVYGYNRTSLELQKVTLGTDVLGLEPAAAGEPRGTCRVKHVNCT